MPKPRKKRKPAPARPTQPSNQPQKFPRWIRYSAVVIILLLMISALVGAIASTPAKAADLGSTPTASFTPLPSCSPQDTDHDGIPNNVDPDIDGDGIVNGKDPDIDGDGIPNAQDPDPASTNCDASTSAPVNISNDTQTDSDVSPEVRISAIIAAVIAGVGYILLRRSRGKKSASAKID